MAYGSKEAIAFISSMHNQIARYLMVDPDPDLSLLLTTLKLFRVGFRFRHAKRKPSADMLAKFASAKQEAERLLHDVCRDNYKDVLAWERFDRVSNHAQVLGGVLTVAINEFRMALERHG